MPPSSLASFVSVAVAGLLLGGCLGQLELCAFHDVEGIRGRIEDCTLDLCFRDEDGDGVAAVDSADDSTCVGGLEVGDYGDCDDTDDNNFPGNVEVCDGLDNDCVGGPDFDSEEDETLPGAAPSCSPAQTPRLFLRGGGWIGPSADGAHDFELVLGSLICVDMLDAGVSCHLRGDLGPIAVLAVVYGMTSVLTECMSNNAAAVLLAPIAISTAQQVGIDPRPLLMAITFAASTGFSTPVGYQTNTMIYNPGGYRYTDFLRTGVPLSIIFWILSVIFIPMFWSF